MKNTLSRRGFIASVSAIPASRGFAPGIVRGETVNDVYRELGVRPFINAAGTYTALSASIMDRAVIEAMESAARSYVSIPELQEAAGTRIASLVGSEAALVTAGCAAALTLATAACVCGEDEEAIRRVPDIVGLKNEVIFPQGHRFGYDHAIRNVGVKIVEVASKEELYAAIGNRTAMLFFLNLAANRSPITREELVEAGKKTGVPTLIDAAADLPPARNLTDLAGMGFDLVAFSGGKGLKGPQCSGLLIGRKDLVRAAFLNGSPHSDSVARIAKVGKEEIVGLTKALELYVARDHDADWKEWESRVSHILSAVEGIDGVTGARFVPEIANEVPHAAINWDPSHIALTRDELARLLREGEPRIEARPSEGNAPRLEIGVWMMTPGDHEVVAARCVEILKATTKRRVAELDPFGLVARSTK
ncbi:MAG TPA: aminotransferase class V-fold PLP-dependent enzyme, partial [Vicinamibacteria bacterium]|nr:aminotransferase class V-fold PLP-dependent enzyme [Vicinamibacteria bacterium]